MFTFVRPARFSPRLARSPPMGRHCITGPRHAIAAAASSRRIVVQRCRGAESSAASTRRPVTWRERWPRPQHSTIAPGIENALRCCLHISSASFGSVVCACVGHVVPSSSSQWRQSRKIFANWQGSSSDHRRSPRRALHKECRVRRRDYLKKFAPVATHLSSPTSATKSAQSRHRDCVEECPLSGVKRTSQFHRAMSAFDAVDGSSTGT